MVLSLSILFRLVTLPATLALITFQYFTIGTSYTNANTKRSLIKTLFIASSAHMVKGATMSDAKFLYKDLKTLLTNHAGLLDDLPGYAEQYTKKDEYDTCASYWLTKSVTSTDSPIIFYIHGGCFALQVAETAFTALANFYRAYKELYGVNISILMIDYTLTTEGAAYPKQINEVNLIYDKLVGEGFRNVITMGDSAGGNLVINTLAYLGSRPKIKDVVWPKATVAISPYLNITKTENAGSVKRYQGVDCFSYSMTRYFGKFYTNGDEWLDKSPMVNIEVNSDKVNWENNPAIQNGDILVVFGDHEILTDQILRWCEKVGLTANHPERIAIDINGTHISVFLDEAISPGTLSEWREQFCSGAILSFLHEKFSD
ncbi:CIC11C00000001103 [Sungouiella intermedia]|uniref:CIC11C00000001103 n=1 Tax=Sungouiella intermedia TaxID=45354 RepID=A0A1L0BXX3_9ASCO|nr:CIC11C00000001103 [[Candida] intermedia]